MGTETYAKNGQVSKKKHVAPKHGKEYYMGSMYEPAPSLGGAPSFYDRKYGKTYKKGAKSTPDVGMTYY